MTAEEREARALAEQLIAKSRAAEGASVRHECATEAEFRQLCDVLEMRCDGWNTSVSSGRAFVTDDWIVYVELVEPDDEEPEEVDDFADDWEVPTQPCRQGFFDFDEASP
jgi:hypothetical protein